MARISFADARLQLKVNFLAAGSILLAEYHRIDRRLRIHSLVIGFENGTFADVVIGRELDAVRKWRQWLLVTLTDAADMNRKRHHQHEALHCGVPHAGVGQFSIGDWSDGMDPALTIRNGFRVRPGW